MTKNFNLGIVPSEGKYTLVIEREDTEPDVIADVFNQEDVLLLAYFIDKAKTQKYDEEDFKNFVLSNISKFPFLSIPTN